MTETQANQLRAFIASSQEAAHIVALIEKYLAPFCHVEAWDVDTFGPSQTYLKSVLDAAERSDFGLFVCTADDVLFVRRTVQWTPRTNVLFELGVFAGHFGGLDRCFILMPDGRGELLPNDLAGFHCLRYHDGRKLDEEIQRVCIKIGRRMQELGLRKRDAERWPDLGGKVLTRDELPLTAMPSQKTPVQVVSVEPGSDDQ